MILVTTSRHPNNRLRSFAKDLAKALPSALKLNRGRLSLEELAVKAKELGANTTVIVGRGNFGNPGRIVFMKIFEDSFTFMPIILGIKGVSLIRELGATPLSKITNEAIIVLGEKDRDLIDLAQGLSEALEMPFYLSQNMSLKEFYDAFMILRRKQYITIEFWDISLKKRVGPKILINKVVYRILYNI